MNLKEIAEKLNVKFSGNADTEISRIGDIEISANLKKDPLVEPGKIYFVESKRILKNHPDLTSATAVLTTFELADEFSTALLAETKDIRLVFISLLNAFAPEVTMNYPSGSTYIDPTARVAEDVIVMPGAVILKDAVVESGCKIYPNVTIEQGAVIGANSVLYSNSVVGHNCIVGSECILHSGVVLGADGFGFRDIEGKRHKIPQIGNVVLGDNVELGANTTIDRATIDSTRIGSHTKIDDQVHIGHNCLIGEFVYIAGNAGIAGSVIIEDYAVLAGQAGIADHVRIGRSSVIMGLTGVPSDTKANTVYFGIPARPVREMHKINHALGQLPDLIKRIKKLEEDAEQSSGS